MLALLIIFLSLIIFCYWTMLKCASIYDEDIKKLKNKNLQKSKTRV